MFLRLLAIAGLIVLMVLGANGVLPSWLGLQPTNTQPAGLVGYGATTDLKAVSGWAHATAAAKACGFTATDAVGALHSDTWDRDLSARRIVEQVRKKTDDGDLDAFCADVLANFGPDGAEIPGLLQPAS